MCRSAGQPGSDAFQVPPSRHFRASVTFAWASSTARAAGSDSGAPRSVGSPRYASMSRKTVGPALGEEADAGHFGQHSSFSKYTMMWCREHNSKFHAVNIRFHEGVPGRIVQYAITTYCVFYEPPVSTANFPWDFLGHRCIDENVCCAFAVGLTPASCAALCASVTPSLPLVLSAKALAS